MVNTQPQFSATFWATFVKRRAPYTIRTLSVLSVCPVCNVGVFCQTVGWIKMKLGLQVGLGPGHIVLDGDPAPLRKRAHPPISGPHLSWPSSWMDQDATWYKCRPRPGRVLRWDPLCYMGIQLPSKGAQPPLLSPCLLWPNGRPSQLLLSTCSQY